MICLLTAATGHDDGTVAATAFAWALHIFGLIPGNDDGDRLWRLA